MIFAVIDGQLSLDKPTLFRFSKYGLGFFILSGKVAIGLGLTRQGGITSTPDLALFITPETMRLIKAPALNDDLRRIDKAIYGHDTAVVESLENLKAFAHQEYQRKLKEVQHGK